MRTTTQQHIATLHELKISCKSCSLANLCLPHGLEASEIEKLDELVTHRDKLEKNTYLFRAGDPLKAIYAVRSGSLKSFMTTPDGEEQITGFYFPGELIGLDGFSSGAHQCGCVSLESSSVCALSMKQFEALCCEMNGLRRQLMRLMGREIHQDHEIIMSLGQLKGEERVASFLYSVSQRLSERGFSATEFNLPMPRHDLANYLGLAVETLSRMISHMHEQGILAANRRSIKILDMPRLQVLAHHQQTPTFNRQTKV